MSDNHEKFQNGFDPNNGSEPVNTNTSANNAVNSTNAYGTYHNAQYPTNNTPAYTWNAQSAPQQNAPVQPNGPAKAVTEQNRPDLWKKYLDSKRV